MKVTRIALWSVAGIAVASGLIVWSVNSCAGGGQKEYKSGIVWPEPKVVTPGKTDSEPPSDAIVLFDGKDLSQWQGGENWEIKDGAATPRKNGITSKQSFGDCQLHIEFATPEKVSGSGQGRGNSGVYMMERYEVQILDSYENKTYFDGQCASLYKQTPPMVNACRKPGEWQSYDIIFTVPHFADDGKVTKPAYVTVIQNGIVVQNHFELLGGTFYDRPPAYEKHAEKLPIHLQFHGNPVKFRNIWIREIQPIVGKKPE
ncbi:MAG TPA: DUF1080 domain-containing protein [Gemmata sp.]|nr:DUF1080 domain-containing protein [Gemmata sp.]